MEAKELRIGNLVYVDDIVESDVEYRVLNLWDFATYLNSMPDLYTPIQLTEEWLIKFGFLKDSDSWFYSLDFDSKQETFKIFELTSNNKPNGLYQVLECRACLPKLKYVHQLQNLYFALTGKELELKDNG